MLGRAFATRVLCVVLQPGFEPLAAKAVILCAEHVETGGGAEQAIAAAAPAAVGAWRLWREPAAECAATVIRGHGGPAEGAERAVAINV